MFLLFTCRDVIYDWKHLLYFAKERKEPALSLLELLRLPGDCQVGDQKHSDRLSVLSEAKPRMGPETH